MRKSLLILILMTVNISAFPQQILIESKNKPNLWKGNATIYYGTDFKYLGTDGHKWMNTITGGEASFGYSNQKIEIEAGGNLTYRYRMTDVTGLTINTENQKDTILKIDFTYKPIEEIRSGCFLKSRWILSTSDKLSFNYSYKYEHNLITNATLRVDGHTDGMSSLTGASGSNEAQDYKKGSHTALLTYAHNFLKPGRTVTAGYEFGFLNDAKLSDWYTGEIRKSSDIPIDTNYITIEREYKIKPHMFEYLNRVNVQYSEKKFADVNGLDMDFILDGKINTNRDHQRAATLHGTEWVDSTSYHEDFTFVTITVSPTAHARYTGSFYTADAAYTPQLYSRKLSGNIYRGNFDYGFISHLVDFKNFFNFRKGHQVSFIYNRSVKRPGYIQICPFERARGEKQDEKLKGDPDLMPEAEHKLDLTYTYRRNRFTISGGIEYDYKFRIIEQTYYEGQDSEGTKTKINTWINGGHSNTNSASLSLAWNGTYIKAHLSGKYNYFHGEAATGKVTFSSDYTIFGDLTYQFKTWTFLVRSKYDSKIIRSYGAKNEVLKCDARVEKKIWKFTLFMEGLDLLDNPYEITTINADQTEECIKKYSNMNKVFRLGVTYKF